jgi:hypothetical protein
VSEDEEVSLFLRQHEDSRNIKPLQRFHALYDAAMHNLAAGKEIVVPLPRRCA